MIVEGTCFVERLCLAMAKEEFVERHLAHFPGLAPSEGRKKLGKIYEKMKAAQAAE